MVLQGLLESVVWGFSRFSGGQVCSECLPNHQHLVLIAHCPQQD